MSPRRKINKTVQEISQISAFGRGNSTAGEMLAALSNKMVRRINEILMRTRIFTSPVHKESGWGS